MSNALIDNGVQSVNLDGMTVYLTSTFHCTKRGDRLQPEAVEVVKSLGLDDMCETVVQPQRLKAWARERIKEARETNPAASAKDALPQTFLDMFNVVELTSIGARRSQTAGPPNDE